MIANPQLQMLRSFIASSTGIVFSRNFATAFETSTRYFNRPSIIMMSRMWR